MHIIVLGGAAGGGFPQWNCSCPNCVRARRGDPAAPARTQCSLAVSADRHNWLLLNASPDLRQQIAASPALHPNGSGRDSPLRAVLLTSAEIDAIAGLLNLRESQPLSLHASERTLALIAANPIFKALDPAFVVRREIVLGKSLEVTDFNGRSLGLTVEPFAVPGKVALYAESDHESDFVSASGDTIGLAISETGNGARFHFVPGCAALSPELLSRLAGSPLVFFDGTVWTDDEMIRLGLGTKTGSRMGHLAISGETGTLAGLSRLDIRRKIFVHVNNTNPILIANSPERKNIAEAGWEVAVDGMEIAL